MRKSKYLGRKFGKWTCTYVGVARVQPKFYQGTKAISCRPGHQTYYYIFERLTSDNKAEKLIRLSAKKAAQVYRGEITVEDLLDQREARSERSFAQKVSYHFITTKN